MCKGIKSSRLLNEKRNRNPIERCEQSFRQVGAKGTSFVNGSRPSDLIKESDVVLFVQSSPPQKHFQ